MSEQTIQQTTQATPPQEEEASPGRLIATLGIAGFFSGMILVGAYLFTLPMIQAHKARALEQAIYHVLPGTTSYQTLELKDGALVQVDGQVTTAGTEAPRRLFAGYNESEELVGFAILTEEPGFQDLIVAIFGYDPQQQVIIGFEVLESKETPGLGDKIIKDADFQANFKALAVEPSIIAVKKGAAQQPNEVEAITGATISSKAIVRLLNKGMEEWKPAISAYVEGKQ